MREFGKLHGSFWANETFKGMSVDCRLLAIYLLTSQHTHMSGAFRLPDAYIYDDLRFDSERLRNGFETLSESGFCSRCSVSHWVWIHKFHVWNAPDNPNMRKAIVKYVGLIPSSVTFRSNVRNLWGVFETVSEPLGNLPSPSPSPSLEEREKPKRRTKGVEIEFNAWIERLGEEKAIPEDDSVFRYAEKIGLPEEYLALAWFWFKRNMPGKKQIDWRKKFRNAVEDNWPKYWWPVESGGYKLSPAGEQAKRAMEAEA